MDEIIRQRVSPVPFGAAVEAATGDALQATLAHQPLHPFAVDDPAEPETFGGDPGDAVGTIGRIVDLDDQLAQVGVGGHLRDRVHLQMSPAVKRGSGHLHRPTARIDGQISPIRRSSVVELLNSLGCVTSRAELVRLRREKRVLEMEVEILKRASAYFARENMQADIDDGQRPGLGSDERDPATQTTVGDAEVLGDLGNRNASR